MREAVGMGNLFHAYPKDMGQFHCCTLDNIHVLSVFVLLVFKTGN